MSALTRPKTTSSRCATPRIRTSSVSTLPMARLSLTLSLPSPSVPSPPCPTLPESRPRLTVSPSSPRSSSLPSPRHQLPPRRLVRPARTAALPPPLLPLARPARPVAQLLALALPVPARLVPLKAMVPTVYTSLFSLLSSARSSRLSSSLKRMDRRYRNFFLSLDRNSGPFYDERTGLKSMGLVHAA